MKTLWRLFFLCLFAVNAHAVRIEIKSGVVKPEPIAIVPFDTTWGNGSLAENIAKVISKNLELSGLFSTIDPDYHVQSPENIQKNGAQLSQWRTLNARFLMAGNMAVSGGKIRIAFRLYDVFSGKTIGGIELSGASGKWRRIAHMISDYVYNRITSEDGFFNTQIAYVETVGAKNRKTISRIMGMDLDGDDAHPLMSEKKLTLGPRYSPDGKSIVYYVLPERSGAEIFVMNLTSKQRRSLGKFNGLRIAPRFSPDSNSIIFSLSKSGTTAIYTQNLRSKEITRITDHKAIDTSPCYDPTGEKIVFTSNRGGRPQLYTMDHNGKNKVRISYEAGGYYQPAWSPRGDLIAFTKQTGGVFYIGVIRPDGSDERLIASGYMLESPVWSPNGRYLIFTRQATRTAKSKIVFIDLTGHNMQEIETPGDASDPAWSPLLGSAIPKR